jgi:hypothetical protein
MSAEKLILDYLGQVSHAAARILPKGDRLLFVGRTRAAIEKRCGPMGTADPAKVREMIAELGEPRAMVKKELQRLEDVRRGGPRPPVVLWKPTRDDWKPAKDDTEPIPRHPGLPPPVPVESPSPGSGQPGLHEPSLNEPSLNEPSLNEPSLNEPSLNEPSPGQSSLDQPGLGQPGLGQPGLNEPGLGQPGLGQPGLDEAGLDEARAGLGQAGAPAPPEPAAAPLNVQALARSHPLETVAVLVLGIGGLIIPLLWLVGGLIAVLSRVWDARDKWLALFGPLIFVLAGLLVAATLVGGKHGFFGEFIHAFDAYREYLIRAGAVATAVYLAWRIRRGPRMRSLPPWQRPHRGHIR